MRNAAIRSICRSSIVALLLAWCGIAFAQQIWVETSSAILHIDVDRAAATGQPATLFATSAVQAWAPVPDGGAWILTTGGHLLRVDREGRDAAACDVSSIVGGVPAQLAVDPTDGAAWIAAASLVVRVDREGTIGQKWQADQPVTALAPGLHQTLYVAGASGLVHLTAEGVVLERTAWPQDIGAIDAMYFDPVKDSFRFVTTLGFLHGAWSPREQATIASTQSRALALTTEWKWDELRAPPGTVDAASAYSGATLHVAYESASGALWIARGNRLAEAVAGHETLALALDVPIVRVATLPWLAQPTLSLLAPLAGEAVQPGVGIVLGFGAQCGGAECAAEDVGPLQLSARLNGRPVESLFAFDADGERATLHPMLPPDEVMFSLEAFVRDALGRASNTIGYEGVNPASVRAIPKASNLLPLVSISAPGSGAAFAAPAKITISATASDPDGTVSKVEFYKNGVLLATDTGAPYSYIWSNVPVGSYSLTAKAYDNLGATTDSATVLVQVNPNQSPAVSITAPASNASYTAPATISIGAVATDADGTISKVEFYRNGTLLGTDTAAPYTYTWSNVPVGSYSLTAKAYDNLGATTGSAAVPVQVNPNQAPAVSITAPVNNTTYAFSPTISITAAATDADGTITKVEFYKNETLIGSDTVPPYTYTWSNVAAGSYTLTAKAYDNGGASTISAPVSILVNPNQAPAVSITAPASGASYSAPAAISISAVATDADGTITKVEFYRNGVLVGSDTTAPYTYTWSNVPVGSYSLTAKAYDNRAMTTVSTPVSIQVNPTVPPTVSITSPVDGAVLGGPATIVITAAAADTDGTITKVEFYKNGVLLGSDTTSPYSYTWNNTPLGSYTLTAKAYDNGGAATVSATVSIQVNVNQPPSISMNAPSALGQSGTIITDTLPPTVLLSADATDADGTIAKVQFYSYSDTLLGTLTAPPYQINWRPPNWGGYNFYAKATDNAGAVTPSFGAGVLIQKNVAPTVSMVAPVLGHPPVDAVFIAPATITLQATATDPNQIHDVAKVEFFVNGTLLGEGTVPVPYGYYTYQWIGVQPGRYSVTARATDPQGLSTDSVPISIVVATVDARPTVQLTAPANGRVYTAPATITISATASDSDGSVSRVDFYAGTTLIGSASAAPYSVNWTAASAGTYMLTARAVDDRGAVTASPAVFIRVDVQNQPPLVTLTAPAACSTYSSPSSIALAAQALDPDGTIAKVDFYADGTLIGTATAAPYSVIWNNPPGGIRTLTAKATDNQNASTVSSPVTITVATNNALPTVALTSPANGASFTAPAAITMTASASDADGTIARVDFYNGATLLGTATSTPYTFTWSNVPIGTYTLSAKATDNSGQIATSSAVTVSVVANCFRATMTAPVNGATYMAPATIPLAATATDNAGTITKVEFRTGTAVIATATSPPYTGTWTNVPAGTYVLSAMAEDNLGLRVYSSTIVVYVTPAQPTVTLIAPANGARIAAGQPLTATAQASMPGQSITGIDFYVDGSKIGTVPVGGAAQAIASLTWPGPPAGAHALSAKAIAADGSSVTAPTINISVQDLSVTLTEPIAGQAYLAPAAIRMTATASETSATIAQVDFYADGALVGSATAAPYTFLWTGAAAGTHTIQARARDALGLISITPLLTVQVIAAGVIDVDPGIDGANVNDDNISVSGTVQAPANSAVIVNGRAASLDSTGRFFANNVPLNPGSNTLTITLNMQDSPAVTRMIIVTSAAQAPFTVILDQQEGLAPLTTNLTITNRGGVPFQRIEVDLDDDGTPENTFTALTDNQVVDVLTFTTPGTRTVRVTVFDQSNAVIYLTRRSARVFEARDLAAKLQLVYIGMLDRLRSGNIDAAMNAITAGVNDKYRGIFTTLGSNLATVVDQLGTIQQVSITESFGEMLLMRQTANGPQSFAVYLLKGGDGVWRIDGM